MNEQKNNKRGVFYGVIGVATLVVAIIGATFAYFTATASNNTVISGNMATITFDLSVTKVTDVDDDKGGMIPMSNSMAHPATTSSKGVCLDNNGNAVCQIYKITVTNTGSASLFLDGYVTLSGGSGEPTDYSYTDYDTNTEDEVVSKYPTTMRWAQAFCTASGDTVSSCTTVGKTTTGATKAKTEDANIAGIDTAWGELGTTSATDAGVKTLEGKAQKTAIAHDVTNILRNNGNLYSVTDGTTGNVTSTGYISGNAYDIISRNYVRVSDHNPAAGYKRTTDITSALVFNQYLDAKDGANDSQDFYIVVWLGETGYNQTASTTGAGTPEGSGNGLSFFSGNVTFNSAQGSEVTATFSGYSAVKSDQA